MGYLSRALEKNVREALSTQPVVVLTGPRQVGKSTLLENASFLKGWRYLTLDDPDVYDQAKHDPKGLLSDQRPTIIDEVQRWVPLMVTVKYYVDASKRKRKFILSGSGNIPLRTGPRESLAGRVRYLHLTPLGLAEMKKRADHSIFHFLVEGKPPPSGDYSSPGNIAQLTWNGGLPQMLGTRSIRQKLSLMADYVDTYLERDIQDLMKIRHPENFRRLMSALAKTTGWASKQEELAQVCGEDRSNVSRYISLLKETALLQELKGYHTKKEKSYRQSKYYWFDSGVACFLAGMNSPKDLADGSQKGRFFENFALQQILFHKSQAIRSFDVMYWQPKGELKELDFVLQLSTGIVPIEVKSSDTLSFRHSETLRRFMASHPEAKQGFLLYSGRKLYPIATNIFAIPIMAL